MLTSGALRCIILSRSIERAEEKPTMTQAQIEILTKYAAKSEKHAAAAAANLTGRTQTSLAYLAAVDESVAASFIRRVMPARRHTESAEVNGHMVDRGEDN